MKWWFLDGRAEQALIRRECPPGQTQNCPIKERKSFAESDGYFAAEARKVQSLLDYMKTLERIAEDCKQRSFTPASSDRLEQKRLDIGSLLPQVSQAPL